MSDTSVSSSYTFTPRLCEYSHHCYYAKKSTSTGGCEFADFCKDFRPLDMTPHQVFKQLLPKDGDAE